MTSPEKSALDLAMRAVQDEREGKLFPAVAAEDGDRAVEILFAFAQEALRWLARSGQVLSKDKLLPELWRVQSLAFAAGAARCYRGRSRAKQLQLKVSLGEPLTVCVGELTPQRLPDLRDVLDPNCDVEEYRIPTVAFNTLGTGCLAICCDSTGLRRPALRKWCQECEKKTTSITTARLTSIRKAWEGSPSSIEWDGDRRRRVWVRRCSVCETSYRTLRANQIRCTRCSAGHRTFLG
jgi:hypothetical protein